MSYGGRYKERAGTPRQPLLGNAGVEGEIVLYADEGRPERALADLDGFEMVWVIAYCHLNQGNPQAGGARWAPSVKPPRGPPGVRRGLFATRSPHRPNQLALSAVRPTPVTD